MQKGFAPAYFLVGILVLIAVAGGAFYLGKTIQKPVPAPLAVSQNPQITTIPTASSTSTPSGRPAYRSLPMVTKQDENFTPETARQILPFDETANWKTYQDFTYNYSIRYPDNWIPIQGKGNNGDSQVTIKSIKTKRASFSSRQLPELIIGLSNPYSTSGAVCSNQICDETKKETVNIDGKSYTFSIIKGAVAPDGNITKPQFDFYAFTLSINHKKINMPGYSEPISLNIYSSYKEVAEEKIILKILSTFKFTP